MRAEHREGLGYKGTHGGPGVTDAARAGIAGEVKSSGGRILGVSALGSDLSVALKRAYQGVSKISFDGAHYRKDIGKVEVG